MVCSDVIYSINSNIQECFAPSATDTHILFWAQ
jgi:hypothetical protein